MARETYGKNSIYYRISKLLVIAFCISAVFFTLIHAGGEALTQTYLRRVHYAEKENERRIGELEAFVRKNKVTPSQAAVLTKWVDRQRVVWLQIYRDNTLLYDSKYSDIEQDTEYYIKNDYSEWGPSRQVEFWDGMADVFLYGMYTYQFLNIALVVELLLSFLLFLGIVMAGIRRSMSYIKRLSSEIEILEDGNLDYPVTVLGKDELAVLANGIDSLRRSVKMRIRQEKELMKMNQAMITGLSHDLRTPLTSLMIYTEILRKTGNGDSGQMQKYLDKIEGKARQIKDMADSILEYSLLEKGAKMEMEEPRTVKSIFYDNLSELCFYLGQRGYEVLWDLEWKNMELCVNSDYIIRILDNITSNILKYARQDKPVRIRSVYTDSCGGIIFENHKQKSDGKVESRGIGLRNIRDMMEEMGGSCEVRETKAKYSLILFFRECENKNARNGSF